RSYGDWSSDVCSSDLADRVEQLERLPVDVDHEQVRVLAFKQRQRLGPVGRAKHPVAVGRQVRVQEPAGGVLLLGQQDRGVGGGQIGRAAWRERGDRVV